MNSRVCADANHWPPRHIRIGFSAESQQYFDERWKEMRKLAAAGWRIYCSAEPLLGSINARRALTEGLEQIIVGGESGAGARPMCIEWVRSLRDQCTAAGAAFFFKQWGEWASAGSRRVGEAGRFALVPREFDGPSAEVREYPRSFSSFGYSVMERVGKKKAGRLLDGREWGEFSG